MNHLFGPVKLVHVRDRLSSTIPLSLNPINDRVCKISTVLGDEYLSKLMRRFHSIIFVFVALSIGCDATSTNPRLTKKVGDAELRIVDLASVNIPFANDFGLEIEKAMKADQSIVFVHVEWAPMHAPRRKFCDFVNAYRKAHLSDGTSFHYIDFTHAVHNKESRKELKGLNGWSELRSGVIHGNGELIWINRGKVVSIEPIMNFTLDELVKKTETTFSGDRP